MARNDPSYPAGSWSGLSVVPNHTFNLLSVLSRPPCQRELSVSGVARGQPGCARMVRSLFPRAEGVSFSPDEEDRAVVRFATEEDAR